MKNRKNYCIDSLRIFKFWSLSLAAKMYIEHFNHNTLISKSGRYPQSVQLQQKVRAQFPWKQNYFDSYS